MEVVKKNPWYVGHCVPNAEPYSYYDTKSWEPKAAVATL